MRVVITGASGNAGSSLIEALAAEDRVDSILGLARRRPAWQPPKTEWAVADVSRDDLAPQGIREGRGLPTPPLEPDAGHHPRADELRSGVGAG